jgi:hypothetical protein
MVEADFRQMKDPSVVSFSPMFHWTDQKIRIHVFYCTLALTVARLMVREVERAGLHLSVRALLGSLAGIEETVLSTPRAADGRGRVACSPRWTRPKPSSTSSSGLGPMHRGAERS